MVTGPKVCLSNATRVLMLRVKGQKNLFQEGSIGAVAASVCCRRYAFHAFTSFSLFFIWSIFLAPIFACFSMIVGFMHMDFT